MKEELMKSEYRIEITLLDEILPEVKSYLITKLSKLTMTVDDNKITLVSNEPVQPILLLQEVYNHMDNDEMNISSYVVDIKQIRIPSDAVEIVSMDFDDFGNLLIQDKKSMPFEKFIKKNSI